MREILFRGKRTDSCEWAYGAPTKDNHGEMVMVKSTFECDEYNCRGANCLYVDENTVGQYTGLTDKNGTKIFEGDIIKYKNTDGIKFNGVALTVIGKVVYNEKNASFAISGKDEIGAKHYDYFPIKNIEVIGNIFDNPEILKG